jgi:hypothetical protein
MNHTYEDISANKYEILQVVNSMLEPNASTDYHLYYLYKEPFERFAYEVIETTKILYYQPEVFEPPPYIEEDKKLTMNIKKKTKTIVDMFIQKT